MSGDAFLTKENRIPTGRSSELDELQSALEGALSGTGRCFLIEGEAGIGKTTLVAEALRRASSAGFQTFVGEADEIDRRRSFGAVADCFGINRSVSDEARAAIARLLFDPRPHQADTVLPAENPHAEFLIVEAMLTLVEELCSRGPVVIALEDLQWADPSTLLVLNRVSRYVSTNPLILICTHRPLPRSPQLQAFVEALTARGARKLALQPLSGDAVAEVMRTLVGNELGPNLVDLAKRAGGNPLFLTELVSTLRQAGSIEIGADAKADVETRVLPPSLPLTILHRLSFVSSETMEVLRVASVLGSRIDLSDLCLVLGRPVVTLMPALREAVIAGILGEQGDGFVFRHDLIREALYDDLPLPVRAGLHRDVAKALADAGSAPERVAEHLMRGARPGDARAVEWLHRTAQEVAPRSPGVTIDLLDKAIDLIEAVDSRRAVLLSDKAIALMWTGRVSEAERTCRDVLARNVDSSTRAVVQICLAQALIARGRSREALEQVDATVESPTLSRVQRASLRGWASLAQMSLGDIDGAAETAGLVIQSAPEGAGDAARCVALTTLATVSAFKGRLSEALDLLDDGLRLAENSKQPEIQRVPVHFLRGVFLMDIDELDEAEQALQTGRRISTEIGAKGNLPAYSWASALLHFHSGHWDDALAEAKACLELADELGTRRGVLFGHALQSIIALHRDDLARAQEAVAAAEREFADTGPQHGLETLVVWARALVLEAEGRTHDALTRLAEAWDELIEANIVTYTPDLGPDLVRLAIACDDVARAETVTAAVEGVAESNPRVARFAGIARRCGGLALGDPDVLVGAVACHRAASRSLEYAFACEDAGVALGRAGRAEEAGPLIDEALGVYDRLEAIRDIARMEAALRAQGLRRGRRGRRKRPSSGWHSLTATELKVADLVAQGLSNPEIAERMFISRHTVHTHVSHILGKLGLSSRVQLAAEAARRVV